ncbi:MAG: adenylosuccinate lyase, partial [Armatimonadetes bacterium]|nr:adenylosuccinate lyase [Anaerolineae bacterium]
EDNADALRLRAGLRLLQTRLRDVLMALVTLIEREAEHVCMAFTHLQPAEPTTVGYRLAGYAQDLWADYTALTRLESELRGKGLKGAVGTGASYADLLEGTGMSAAELEARVMAALDLAAFPIAMQTYPRHQEWDQVNVLAGIAMTLYRFAFDVRLLQAPSLGEWAEPFGKQQVGSSAMPFKRNPIHSENIDSLARYVAALPRVAWDNAAHHLLERTLDDSGNRRVILPEAFLATDELLTRTLRILNGLRIDDGAIARNLGLYGTFAATERVLMAAARAGGDRQQLHEVIREHSLRAWEALRQEQPNPLVDSLSADEHITRYVTSAQVRALLHAEAHIGDAPQRARALAAHIKAGLAG